LMVPPMGALAVGGGDATVRSRSVSATLLGWT
jgi:hypothetical protein